MATDYLTGEALNPARTQGKNMPLISANFCSTLGPTPPHISLQTIRGHAGQGALVMFAQHVPLSTSPLPFSPSLPYFQFFTAVSGQTADGRQ